MELDKKGMNTTGDFNDVLAKHIADSISVGPVQHNTEPPVYQGDFAKTVFLWAYGQTSHLMENDEYPEYLLFECGIRDASKFHRQMIDEGYLEKDIFVKSLESLKLIELKEIAEEFGLAKTGTKSEIAERIVNSGKTAFLERQMPSTYSLSSKGKAFVEDNDDCVQIHKNKMWMIKWPEYSSNKEKYPNDSFYTICKRILIKRAENDKRIFGRGEYQSLAELEKNYGDPKKAIRYYLQVVYIDVSGSEGVNSYQSYQKGYFKKEDLIRMFVSNVAIAPGIIERIKKLKDYYDSSIIEKLYTWKLPVMICEKELFVDMINSVFDDTFAYQFYNEQLHVRYEKYIDALTKNEPSMPKYANETPVNTQPIVQQAEYKSMVAPTVVEKTESQHVARQIEQEPVLTPAQSESLELQPNAQHIFNEEKIRESARLAALSEQKQKEREVFNNKVQSGAKKAASVFGTVIGWIVSSILFLIFLVFLLLLTTPQETVITIIAIITLLILSLQIVVINPLLTKLIPSVPFFTWIKRHRIPVAAILAGIWLTCLIILMFIFPSDGNSSQFESAIERQKIEEITAKWEEDGIVDYKDIGLFEQDLNNNARLAGKTVTFKVTEARELTELGTGYALEGGNTIVFISKDNPGVNKGETVTVIVTGVTDLIGGGYRVSYVLLEKK